MATTLPPPGRRTTTRGAPVVPQAEGDLSFFDDLEPRAPPAIPRFPLAFDLMEKPRPLVPEASLIFDSAGLSSFNNSRRGHFFGADDNNSNASVTSNTNKSKAGNETNGNESEHQKLKDRHFISSHEDSLQKTEQSAGIGEYRETLEDLKTDWNELANKLNSLEVVVSSMDQKLNKIMEFQEVMLSQMFKNDLRAPTDVPNSNRFNQPSVSNETSSSRSVTNSTPVIRTTHKISKQHKGDVKEPIGPHRFANNGALQKLKSDAKQNVEDDLSAILKDMQLPNLNEPSVFSEVSAMKSLELQEFNDDSFRSRSGVESPEVGASASAFNSSSSDEEDHSAPVKPTATFYNNVLGNVNRLLKGRSESRSSPKNRGSSQPVDKMQTPTNRIRENLGQRKTVPDRNVISNSSSASSSQGSTSGGQVDSKQGGEEVVEATKRYLEKLGVQFGTPSSVEKKMNLASNSNNYMIQQNVYNSIYIPTVNCIPAIPETLDSNANSGNFNVLAHKYVPSEELKQHQALVANPNGSGQDGITDTTVYGMSPNNLSFATKQYLQRYGLVKEESKRNETLDKRNDMPRMSTENAIGLEDNRILDITAIKNQPKLLWNNDN